jgi:transposase
VDTNGLPVYLALTPGEAHDDRLCSVLLSAVPAQTMLLADRGYDAYRARNLIERFGASRPDTTNSQPTIWARQTRINPNLATRK